MKRKDDSVVWEEAVYDIPKGAAVVCRCDAPFTVYEVIEDDGSLARRVPLGPDNVHDRVWRGSFPMDATVVVLIPEGSNLAVEITPRRGETDPVDSRPVEWPAGLKAPLSLEDRMRRLIRTELSRVAAEQDAGTFEEEDDFEDDDEAFPSSPYELPVVEEVPVQRSRKAQEPPAPPASPPPYRRKPCNPTSSV